MLNTDINTPRILPSNNGNYLESRWDKFKHKAKIYATIIDSREAYYRAALDLAADIPYALAALTRNRKNFIESTFEVCVSFFMLCAAPFITSGMSKILGKFLLPHEDHLNSENLLLFKMNELDDLDEMQKGVSRIIEEEPGDQNRIASLYKELGNEKKEKEFTERANKIKNFFKDFKPSKEIKEKIYKLKRAIILAESMLEGGVWGGFGFILRGFRKYVLKENRFTGTKSYLSDKDSKKIGEGGNLSLLQKILGGSMMFSSPVINNIFLSLTKNKKPNELNSFLQMIKRNIDMVHGIFPNLGLMFTYTSLPKWFGTFITAQGWTERIERLLKFMVFMPSWWLGHKVTNGYLANHEDKKLAEQFNVDRGILVEPKDINSLFKEPTRIHHVLSKTANNPELQKAAKEKHASVLYKGFSLHSAMILFLILIVNAFTKYRVLRNLNKK